MRKINLIVLHCSATRETMAYTPEQLESDHKARGFLSAGHPKDTRTPEQHVSIMNLLLLLLLRYPGCRICGHRDLSPDRNGDGVITPDEWLKECPCFDAEVVYGIL